MGSAIVKRSVYVSRHKTSVSLEDEFWDSLKEIAKESGEPVSQLISDINKGRQSQFVCLFFATIGVRSLNKKTTPHLGYSL
jgi:predicted DNA-binding ribbon-helix-helix protein